MQQDGTWRQLVGWQADLRLNQCLGQKEAAEEPWEVGWLRQLPPEPFHPPART